MKRLVYFMTMAASMLAIVLISSQQANTKSNGSPLANTGSLGDGTSNTCAKGGCHVGTVNAFSGSVSIDLSDIPADGYRAGEQYNIGVTVAETGRNTFGFQLTAEDASGNKMGSYEAGNGSRLEFTNWITHSMNSSTGTWSFKWTAPNAPGDIIFYAAGNAANGNGVSSGDHVYTSSDTISKSIFSSTQELDEKRNILIYHSISTRELILDLAKEGTFVLYDLSGKMIREWQIDQGKTTISTSQVLPGAYIIAERSTGYSKKIILR